MSEINKKVKCNLVNCGFTYPRKINHRKKNILKIKLNRDFYQDVFKAFRHGLFYSLKTCSILPLLEYQQYQESLLKLYPFFKYQVFVQLLAWPI